MMTVSMDANFGLVRKKNAGKSLSAANCGSQFFIDDGMVNDFVETYYEHNVKDQVCNNSASLLGLFVCQCQLCQREM